MHRFTVWLTKVLASRLFFWGVVAFLVLEALWVTFSAVYPMAFDEDFHFGVIQIYAHQWSPFLHGQPDGANAFSAVARDPSYLYHYLMSFPYRLLTHLTHNQTAQIIGLRLINIGLFALSLVLFRRVLLKAKLSPALAHAALALFVLIPIVPLLAAQINYDNLLMVLVAWTCLVVHGVYAALRERRVAIGQLALLIILCLFASVVKYSFLPIALAAFAFITLAAVRYFRGRGRLLLTRTKEAVLACSWRAKLLLGAFLVLGLIVFAQRYLVNTVRYHTPLPKCNAVLSEEECSAYGPWERDHILAQAKGSFNKNPAYYMWQWLCGMWTRLFFMVNGPASQYDTRKPMPVPGWTAVALAVAGVAALLIWWRRVFRGRAFLGFLLGIIVLYSTALWADNYSQYLGTSQPVAVNGRYLLPLLLPAAALLGTALHYALRRAAYLKGVLAAAVLAGFLQGGGVLAFIVRSDYRWDWHNSTVVQVNDEARHLLWPFIFKGKDR